MVICLYSCSKDYDCSNDFGNYQAKTIATRTAGDGKYDVLGYGYDVTEEYMGESSTKSKVLDVAAFDRENPNRFENPFLGTIDQRIYAGEDASSFLNEVSTNSNFSGSVGSVGIEANSSDFFSGTISGGFKSNTKYSYSSKYSFARAEVFKKQRKLYLNTDLKTLRKYLSPTFLEDLNKYSADKIVEIYGTHVLTNVIIGGKYIAYYKSVITETTDRSEKTKVVSAGAKFNLSEIGLDANGTWSSTEITEVSRKNSNWKCFIKSIGGSTSGTSMTLSPSQGPTFTINLGDWTKSIDDQHANLIDVDWNSTYPIYELISDPVKKQQIKDAVLRYIKSKKIEILALEPLYKIYNVKTTNNFNVMGEEQRKYWLYVESGAKNRELECLLGYVLKNEADNTEPLHDIYNKIGRNDFSVMGDQERDYWLHIEKNHKDRVYERQTGFVYKEQVSNTIPLYRIYNKKSKNTFSVAGIEDKNYWLHQAGGYKNRIDDGQTGYIYPAD